MNCESANPFPPKRLEKKEAAQFALSAFSFQLCRMRYRLGHRCALEWTIDQCRVSRGEPGNIARHFSS